MKKNNVRVGIMLAAIFVAWQVLAFAPPFVKNGVFWVSWLFADLAILGQAYVLHIAFANGKAMKSKVYGFPIARLGALYAIAQLVVSFVCIILAAWIPMWVLLIVDVLLLAAAVVGLSAADVVRDEVERQDEKIMQYNSVIRRLYAAVSALAKQSGNDAVANLADNLRHSDPVSSTALAELEQALEEQSERLAAAVKAGETTAIQRLCAEMEQTLIERNARCKLTKHK